MGLAASHSLSDHACLEMRFWLDAADDLLEGAWIVAYFLVIRYPHCSPCIDG